MTSNLFPGQGGFREAKDTDIWTDVVIVGGSVPHETGGNVQFIYGSGASATAKFGTTTVGALTATTLTLASNGVPNVSGNVSNPYIEFGLSGTGAGSGGWVNFLHTWSTTPKVYATCTVGSGWATVGSADVGSFFLFTASPSITVNWLAVGTK